MKALPLLRPKGVTLQQNGRLPVKRAQLPYLRATLNDSSPLAKFTAFFFCCCCFLTFIQLFTWSCGVATLQFSWGCFRNFGKTATPTQHLPLSLSLWLIHYKPLELHPLEMCLGTQW